MTRDWAKNRDIDRSSWGAGPWDNEPDYYEWTTEAGYSAYAGRLDTGTWYGIVVAPYPTESMMLLAFCHHIRDKYFNHGRIDHQPGVISKTDQEGIGEYCMSMEHYKAPSDSENKPKRGPYKTLEDVKVICENNARYIFETLQDKSYVDYHTRRYEK